MTDTGYIHRKSDRIDKQYRVFMLIMGVFAALFFLTSLISLIEFPAYFRYFALAMLVCTVVFFILRAIYNFRNTFRVKEKKKATRN